MIQKLRTIFIGGNLKEIAELFGYLKGKEFSVQFKQTEKSPYSVQINAKSYYTISVISEELNDAFNQGLIYCIENNYDDIICGYPNLDFDTVKNIKEREFGLNK